jgi:hypothetical protein
MKVSRTTQTFLKIILGASAFTATTIGNAAENGIIIDGINFALAQNLSFDGGGAAIPVTYTDPFNQNQIQPSTWMLDCSTSHYQSCTSVFTKDLKDNLGNNITYLLLDFPSIDTDQDSNIPPGSVLDQCPITDGVPAKFSPLELNYVAPFITNSPDLGPINVCIDGKKITQAFASQGHKVIPMISGSGSDLDKLNLSSPAYLSTLATLIGTEIKQDPSASGVAFDLEPNIKGLANNQAFFGTLAQAIYPKIIMIYNGDWLSISSIKPLPTNIIAMGAMYDFGLEDSETQNHWFQDISPTSYGLQFSNELNAFLNGYASTLNKMIVIPAAASDTMWTGLDILNNDKPDKAGIANPDTQNKLPPPSTYDPYLIKAYNPSNLFGDPDSPPSEYTNTNPNYLLQMATTTSCPASKNSGKSSESSGNNENCYNNPYADAQINGNIDQDSYVKKALSAQTLSAIQTGKLKGIIFYNIKPNNFYELNCANPVQSSMLCMSFQPESIPASVINDFKSLTSPASSSSIHSS